MLHGMDDSEAMQEEGSEKVPLQLYQRDIWHTMFLSGMLPFEHYDRAILQAGEAGRKVSLVDMPIEAQLHVVEYAVRACSNTYNSSTCQ
jgi:hypothetical protein